MKFVRALAALALFPLLAASGLATAQSLTPVRMITFPAPFNWPLWVAEKKGLFAKHGIALQTTPTPDSVFLMTNLIDGKFDIAMTAIDNLIAYREGQGEVPADGSDLFVMMGGHSAFLRLVAAADIRNVRDLKGRTLAVDALTTGYAFVLREMLERGGLKPDDYKLERVGGTQQRVDAIVAGKQAATLVNAPLDVFLAQRGFNTLGSAVSMLGAYQGTLGMSRRSWAEKNRDTLVRYIASVIEGVEWLYDPANRDEALAIFIENQKGASPQLAATAYSTLLDPKEGFARKAAIDIEGVKTVLALREKYATPKKTFGDPLKYYDPSYYEAALKRIGAR